MATYPDDASISIESFSVVAATNFTNTGSSTTTFALGAAVSFTGEVIAIVDGITQATDSYTLNSDGDEITFLSAPNASNLTLKVVSIPSRFRINRTIDQSRAVNYSNSSATVVDSNTFLINSNTESFALAQGSNATTTDELFVYVSGVFRNLQHTPIQV